MHGLFAGLTTVDITHQLDHIPDLTLKTNSTRMTLAAGGPATNAAAAFAALSRIAGISTSTHLLSTAGRGLFSDLLCSDLSGRHVSFLDATSERGDALDPSVASIIEHPGGRMVTATGARVDLDEAVANTLLTEALEVSGSPDVVLVDGHNPLLAQKVLHVGTARDMVSRGAHGTNPNKSGRSNALDANIHGLTAQQDADPFAELEDRPGHLRILDGGSWKQWFTPLLGLIDVAVISADFHSPLTLGDDPDSTAEFLKGFGINRVVRTNGSKPVHWWWDEETGELPPPSVDAVSTSGAGDIFHGAFAWAAAHRHATAGTDMSDPSDTVAFANEVASLSTTHSGTVKWVNDPFLPQIVAAFI